MASIIGALAAGLIGNNEAEQKMIEEFKIKYENISTATKSAGIVYDSVFYLVAVNPQRVDRHTNEVYNDFMQELYQESKGGSEISIGQIPEAIQTIATKMKAVEEFMKKMTGT